MELPKALLKFVSKIFQKQSFADVPQNWYSKIFFKFDRLFHVKFAKYLRAPF